MANSLVCWKCGASIKDYPLPLGRLDQCAKCNAFLHVCKLCVFFDPNTLRACKEKDAEEVADKTRSNYCDYFKPHANAFDSGAASKQDQAKQKLDSLFGDGDTDTRSSVPDELNDLFKPKE